MSLCFKLFFHFFANVIAQICGDEGALWYEVARKNSETFIFRGSQFYQRGERNWKIFKIIVVTDFNLSYMNREMNVIENG